jgi:hypothetical protein
MLGSPNILPTHVNRPLSEHQQREQSVESVQSE